MSEDKFGHIIHIISATVLKLMVVIMTLALILGSVNLCYNLVLSVINPPSPGMLSVTELYSVFKLVLIIVVGYELIKSILIILQSDSIPARTILSIALIAIANKVITLDISHSDPIILFGLAGLVVCFGAAVFLISKTELGQKKDDH
jgi:uncharacterized membrane protein (DUF373 family)